LSEIYQNETPEPELNCLSGCVEKAKALWRADVAKAEPFIFTVEMHTIVPFGK
jgi:hypothetical protein